MSPEAHESGRIVVDGIDPGTRTEPVREREREGAVPASEIGPGSPGSREGSFQELDRGREVHATSVPNED